VRSIAIMSSSVSLDAVLAVLARPSLEELTVRHLDDDVAKAIRRQKRLPRLRRLQLKWTGETADGGRLLAREELADLESLSIQLRARGIDELGAALAAHRALRVLSIDARSCTDPRPIAALVATLPDTIEELELELPHDLDGVVMAALPGRSTPLRALALIVSSGLHHLDLRAPAFASLERLKLRDVALGDRVIDALVDRAPPLVELDLASCDIGPEGSTALAGSRLLERVERLSLAHDPIDPRVPLALIERPGFLERVVPLALSFCGLGGSSVDPVLAALASAPRIAKVWIHGNALGRDGIAALRALQDAHVSVGAIPERPVPTPEPLHERLSLERERREREVPASPVPLVRPWPRIDRWLAANDRAVLRSLRPPLRDADAALEKAAQIFGRIGEPLADAYCAHDGQKGEASQFLGAMRAPDNALWVRGMSWHPLSAAIRTHLQMLDLGVGWERSWFPFGWDGGGNLLVVEAASGEVSVWDHETAELTTVSPRLDLWMEQLANDMDARLVVHGDDVLGLDLLATPLPPEAPPSDRPPDLAARNLLVELFERRLLAPVRGADPTALLAALQGALAARTIAKRRAQVLAALEHSPAIDEIFADDKTLEQLLRELG
jgi:cell wall assembly regulator SMI1